MPPVDPTLFRQLLGSFATGIAVVTTRTAEGNLAGMTANAISSVSLRPPLLLVCIDRKTDFHHAISGAPRFALNILAADQEALSRRFAADLDDRFAGVAYTLDPTGLPLLDGVAAHVICEVWEARSAGDHTLFIGQVTGGNAFPHPPLLHFRGAYHRPP
jgi:flavin reductase (DIM6/NTAB) family NADH-FMN oxidoreductase RutF